MAEKKEERWKLCTENENFMVSDRGRVMRITKMSSAEHGDILKGTVTGSGYRRVNFGNQFPMIHRLVANAFLNKPRGAEVVNHIDGDKLNNSVSNLEWITQRENVRHAHAKGLCMQGDRHHSAKLDAEKVRAIRILAKDMFYAALSRIFSVNPTTVSDLVQGKTWSHVN